MGVTNFRALAILRYQLERGVQFLSSHGVVTTPLGKPCYRKKALYIRRELKHLNRKKVMLYARAKQFNVRYYKTSTFNHSVHTLFNLKSEIFM